LLIDDCRLMIEKLKSSEAWFSISNQKSTINNSFVPL